MTAADHAALSHAALLAELQRTRECVAEARGEIAAALGMAAAQKVVGSDSHLLRAHLMTADGWLVAALGDDGDPTP